VPLNYRASLLVIGRNNQNTNANGPLGSPLAEPAAANDALRVFAAGNNGHAEVSTDGGATWTNVPLQGGPADAPILCCDQDVVIDGARRVTFHSVLYTNSAITNGVVRIFVRRTPPAADCSYTIDPAGAADNIIPDFPKLGLTKRFLYLTISADRSDITFHIARIYRLNIDQMSGCETVDFSSVDEPCDFSPSCIVAVWRPAEGTNNIEAMYWGQSDNTTTFRIFRWREDSKPTSVTRRVTASTFSEPDCRGGVGDNNWVDPIT
jgi:hypothetical protein